MKFERDAKASTSGLPEEAEERQCEDMAEAQSWEAERRGRRERADFFTAFEECAVSFIKVVRWGSYSFADILGTVE